MYRVVLFPTYRLILDLVTMGTGGLSEYTEHQHPNRRPNQRRPPNRRKKKTATTTPPTDVVRFAAVFIDSILPLKQTLTLVGQRYFYIFLFLF